jgi:hypothetical protein
MDSALIGQVGVLLASLGAALQWLRAQKGFPEWGFYGLAFIFTAGGCWLAMDGSIHVTKRLILDSWPIYLTLLGTTLGGTGTASNVAKGIAKANPGAEDNMLVPVTNSKGG